MRTKVVQHVSSRADDVMKWIMEVEKAGSTYQQFEDPGLFPELDVDLVSALHHAG